MAAAEYATFEHLARSESLRGLAVASRASMLERAGIRTEAISAYQRLLDQFADAYSPAGRPFSFWQRWNLLALDGPDPRLRHTRKDLVSGGWSVTHDQATYFLERLPAPSAPESSRPSWMARVRLGGSCPFPFLARTPCRATSHLRRSARGWDPAAGVQRRPVRSNGWHCP